MHKNSKYWDTIAEEYQATTEISCNDFHYGPLLPGDKKLQLLPKKLKGKKCLEIGCGAAQNSIYLAKAGAKCTAFDISEEQIKHARKLMEKEKVVLDLKCTSMDNPEGISGKFDLIHSTYAISFSENPENVAKFAAEHLSDDGCFIMATGHPLAQGEWLELDDDHGVFMMDYFHIPSDIRYDKNNNEEISSKTYPISTIASWITNANMCIEGIYEPPINPSEIKKSPYFSEKWAEYADMFTHVPAVVIFICRK